MVGAGPLETGIEAEFIAATRAAKASPPLDGIKSLERPNR